LQNIWKSVGRHGATLETTANQLESQVAPVHNPFF
jgi:hypothetical protein